MKVSARNVLPWTVVEVNRGAVNAEILLDVSDSTRLVAIITKESAENLDVRVGDNACALIKASHIILAVD